MTTDNSTQAPNPSPSAPAPSPREEPKPFASEDSVPQDEGTDNSWQLEPFEKP